MALKLFDVGQDEKDVFKAALLSRCFMLVMMKLSDAFIDYKNDDPSVFQWDAPAHLVAFTRWDASHFLAIAEAGYETVQQHAFFPALPLVLRVLSPGRFGRAGLIVTGVLVTNACFVLAAVALHRLGRRVLQDRSAARCAAMLFCANPASVFMSSVYTEAPFALAVFESCAVFEVFSALLCEK